MGRGLHSREMAVCGEEPQVLGATESRDSTFSFILRVIDELHLPKFSISTDYSLEDVLPELGIREVFSTQADLSAITGAKDLRVSQVRQETGCGSA